MRTVAGFRMMTALVFFAPLLTGISAGAVRSADPPPNVVLIFIDNVGYGDPGCYGNAAVRTPHIDALARQGVRGTSFYVGSPSCMPSHGALLTGRHPLRNGLNVQLSCEPLQNRPHDGRFRMAALQSAGGPVGNARPGRRRPHHRRTSCCVV